MTAGIWLLLENVIDVPAETAAVVDVSRTTFVLPPELDAEDTRVPAAMPAPKTYSAGVFTRLRLFPLNVIVVPVDP